MPVFNVPKIYVYFKWEKNYPYRFTLYFFTLDNGPVAMYYKVVENDEVKYYKKFYQDDFKYVNGTYQYGAITVDIKDPNVVLTFNNLTMASDEGTGLPGVILNTSKSFQTNTLFGDADTWGCGLLLEIGKEVASSYSYLPDTSSDTTIRIPRKCIAG